ncbi:hypothetical protein TREMEDRAFT_62531 [Tremella mesenterica DSM 1558]|uniref:uncharacterized protein n=1 Tax=Tremella mesenterica (strain ATCC 24925 / CBS 8224 / DSM 1558 / NBRC 9311 / NRRL Y-6157 / RJB 2259-6 / UBC 559-6) TaxID=578456 RepID=UPI0003F4A2DF|nr:uncharacterized protein TREMEDRAFT_62531 [Tremella mesenterica DSM 1558]EIW69662.1 hypothetical protein TREMEDRAFT_62531 [Tremella mesenterica DSM 1558]
MFYDLNVPFPLPDDGIPTGKKKDKGKMKVGPDYTIQGTYWSLLTGGEKEKVSKNVSMLGHLGYSVIGCTVTSEPSNIVPPCPFSTHLPFPELDPRTGTSSCSSGISSGEKTLVQVTRFHMRLDDAKTHCFSNSNTSLLKQYDILSVQPTTEKAFQLACTDLSNPGPNQISIITLPLHERGFHYRLNRKQLRQAQRNGVIMSSPFPLSPLPTLAIITITRESYDGVRYRQNFLSNAREAVRATSGHGLIFSSGTSYSSEALRAPLDLVSIGVVLGMPLNLAREMVGENARKVLLRAQARKTYKAVLSVPRLILPITDEPASQPDQLPDMESNNTSVKRPSNTEAGEIGTDLQSKKNVDGVNEVRSKKKAKREKTKG